MSIVFIISAPSGSGKSTLVQLLMERTLSWRSRFPTPRARRAGTERHGEDYRFITREEFETRI